MHASSHMILPRRRLLTLGSCWILSAATAGPAIAERWPAEWQVGSFLFHADFQLPTSAPILDELVELQTAVPETLGITPGSATVHVYLFSTRRIYETYMRQYFPGVPARRAMYIQQQGQGMVFAHYGREFAEDLRHETTHGILHAALPFVPLWLDEGLAEYFEVPAEQRYAGHPHLREFQSVWKRRHAAPLSHLEGLMELEQMTRDDYRDAWAWVHFLLHGPPAVRAAFRAFLRDLHSHTHPGPLRDRLPDRPAGTLARQLHDHLRA